MGVPPRILVAPELGAPEEDIFHAGVLEKRRYSDHPPRSEYRLTDKGRALFPVIAALL